MTKELTPTQKLLEKYQKEHYEKHTAKFRGKLKEVKNAVNADLEEIANGFSCSKQKVINFLNHKEENIKYNQYQQPFTSAEIKSLWEALTDESIYEDYKGSGDKSKRKKIEGKFKEERVKLKQSGYGELLELAGYLPEESIVSDGFSREVIEKSRKIIMRLSNKNISNEDIYDFEDTIADKISESLKHTKETNSSLDIDNAVKDIAEKYSIPEISTDLKSFEKILSKYKKLGKNKIDEVEEIELFHSITDNKKQRKLINSGSRITVIKCEIRTLDYYYNELKLIKPREKDLSLSLTDEIFFNKKERIITHIEELGSQKENEFNESSADRSISLIKEVSLLCRTGNGVGDSNTKQNEFYWSYRSNSTTIQNMLDAIVRGIGVRASLDDMTIATLSPGTKSLAKVSSFVRFPVENDSSKSKLYRGTWVDIDILLCIAQSFICATEIWIKDEKLQLGNDNIYSEISEIDRLINKARSALDDYQTQLNLDKHVIKTDQGQHIPEDDSDRQYESLETTLGKIINNSDKVIGKIEDDFQYLREILRYAKEYALLLQIRIDHIHGNVESAGKKLGKFIGKTKSNLDGSIVPIKLMYKTEKLINNFYTGNLGIIENRSWYDNIDESEVAEYLRPIDSKPTITYTSLYYSLSEFYGNRSKLDFYLTLRQTDYEQCIDGFLCAAYFALKNNNGVRFSYWMCYVARACARLENSNDILDTKIILSIAEQILMKSFNPKDYDTYRRGMRSKYNLAHGECLYFDYVKSGKSDVEKLIDSLTCILKAAIGCHLISFERLLCDAIFNLHRICADLINHFDTSNELNEDRVEKIESILKEWLVLFKYEKSHDSNIEEECDILHDSNIEEKCDILNDSNIEEKCDILNDFITRMKSKVKNLPQNNNDIIDVLREISDDAIETVTKKWDGWNCNVETPDKKHPIYYLIGRGDFLCYFKK
jgi:hypothetical protein